MVPKENYSQLELMQARVHFVPDGWKFNYVGKTFAIRNNLRKPISEEEREKKIGSYPYYGPTKIQGYIDSYEQDGSYALIGEDGDHFLKYQVQSMTQLVDGKCTVNNHAHIIEGTKKASREWFYYYFMHRDIFSFLSRQGAGRYKLNKAALEKIPVLVPLLPEQQKIAKILSTWDKAIATTEKLIVTSQQQKKALMQQLLTGKKRLVRSPEKKGETGKVFEGDWEEVKLKKLGKCLTGLTYSPDDVCEDGILVLRSSNIQNGKLCFDDNVFVNKQIKDEVKTKYGDILVCVRNGSRNLIGKSAFITDRAIGQTHGAFMTLFRGKYPELVYQLFQTPQFYKQVNMNLGATINSINTSDLHKFKFKIPCDVLEVKKIALVLTSADREIELLEAKLAHLKDEKKALMQQLLTGKRRVKVN